MFFGDNVKPEIAIEANEAVDNADALLVVGSSLQVFSAYRLVRRARDAGKCVGLLTVGETRADDIADFKVEARCGEALSRLLGFDGGSLALPSASLEVGRGGR